MIVNDIIEKDRQAALAQVAKVRKTTTVGRVTIMPASGKKFGTKISPNRDWSK